MANVSTGFNIGVVKLSHTQAIAKSRMIPDSFVFYCGTAAMSCLLKDGNGNDVWRAWGNDTFYPPEHRSYDKLTVGVNLAAGDYVYIYLK